MQPDNRSSRGSTSAHANRLRSIVARRVFKSALAAVNDFAFASAMRARSCATDARTSFARASLDRAALVINPHKNSRNITSANASHKFSSRRAIVFDPQPSGFGAEIRALAVIAVDLGLPCIDLFLPTRQALVRAVEHLRRPADLLHSRLHSYEERSVLGLAISGHRVGELRGRVRQAGRCFNETGRIRSRLGSALRQRLIEHVKGTIEVIELKDDGLQPFGSCRG